MEISIFHNDFFLISEPPKSISVVQNKEEIKQGEQVTVVDGKVTFKITPLYKFF